MELAAMAHSMAAGCPSCKLVAPWSSRQPACSSRRRLPVAECSRRCLRMNILAAAASREFHSDLIAEKSSFKVNLNEYLVTLERPLGIRFAHTSSGKVYVDALVKQGSAYSSGLIMVGDLLKKVSIGDVQLGTDDFAEVMNRVRTSNKPVTLVLERSAFQTQIQSLILQSKIQSSQNHGRVGAATWDNGNLASPYRAAPESEYGGGSVGFIMYSWRFLLPGRLTKLMTEEEVRGRKVRSGGLSVIATYTDADHSDGLEWTHGNFPVEEFTSAEARSASDLTYNRRFGLRYTKLTDHVLVGSCLENGTEVQHLKELGITAILNLQPELEQQNWGVEKESIKQCAEQNNIVTASCPIRDSDTVDLRRKLPLAVGTLYRMLRLGHRVYVTCASGLDRSPTCVVGYLHWIQDVPLQAALDFVTNLHPSAPDRAALAWATWDLIAFVEEGNHEGPPTHAVQFVWNHGCKEGEEVLLVGDFKGEWNEPIKASHIGGPKYAADLRLPQGKYQYKFIVGGQWRHSNSLPTEVDRWGNVNNVVVVGSKASIRFDESTQTPTKGLNTIRVIERLLTEEERFMLAFAARRIAFSICPWTLEPKRQM